MVLETNSSTRGTNCYRHHAGSSRQTSADNHVHREPGSLILALRVFATKTPIPLHLGVPNAVYTAVLKTERLCDSRKNQVEFVQGYTRCLVYNFIHNAMPILPPPPYSARDAVSNLDNNDARKLG